jgi:hypothetical protein
MPDTPNDRRRRQILDEIATLGYCLPGSVVDRTSRCGKPNCRCHADPARLHGPYHSWTRKVAGKTTTRNLSDEQLEQYQDWFDNDKRLHALVNELEQLSLTVIAQAEGWQPKS